MEVRKEVNNYKKVCCYCGSSATTVDHVPSKVLLDEPYPKNLYTVECCRRCNNGFSQDEEFFAVLVECVKFQSFNPDDLSRPKVIKAITNSQKLIKSVQESVLVLRNGFILINADNPKVQRVLSKLIRGHLRYESGLLLIDTMYDLKLYCKSCCSKNFVDEFLRPMSTDLLSEVGSRALLKLGYDKRGCLTVPWVTIQKGNYEYCVAPDNSEIKILIGDYLMVDAKIKDDF